MQISSLAPTTGGTALTNRCNTGQAGSSGGIWICRVRLAQPCIDFELSNTNKVDLSNEDQYLEHLRMLVNTRLAIQV